MNAWNEVLAEGQSETRSIDLTLECERLNAAFLLQHRREPTTVEELALWEQAFATVYR